VTALRHRLVLGLAVLLAAGTAVADIVITAEEVLVGTVGSADISSLDLKLPQGCTRIIYTRDILEVRMPYSSRVAELAAQLPGAKVELDSGQPVPPRDARVQEMLRLRLERASEAFAKGLPPHGAIIDTLPRSASPAEMTARCRDMDFVLRECGRSDETVAGLLREVNREAEALRRNGLHSGTCCISGACGGLLGGIIGVLVVLAYDPSGGSFDYASQGALIPPAAGCVLGSAIGATLGTSLRTESLTRQRRSRVSDLIRRVNRAVVAEP
jgi:hypothetical protein